MDSVPYYFCLDVMKLLQRDCSQFDETVDVLTGRWKAAARRCADNMHTMFVSMFFQDDKWQYTIFDCRENDYGSTFEDVLALDRRFVRCTSIKFVNSSFGHQSYDTTCSKILNEMIPFFVQQSGPYSSLHFTTGLPVEHARMFLKPLRRWMDLGLSSMYLKMSYYGQQSEDFVAEWVVKDLVEGCLHLYTSWPQTQAVEDLVLKYLRRKNYIDFYIYGSTSEIEGPLNLNAKLLEATLDTWSKLDNDSFFTVGGPWSKDVEDLLSIPLPPNVTRAEPTMDGEKVSTIEWTKEDGATLQCKIEWNNIEFQRSAITIDK
uniref:Ig-like domain-containing protein n=1 Tax=Steinernema glaseri TaxID=37863 RepID=A0A1I7Y694_9BILA